MRKGHKKTLLLEGQMEPSEGQSAHLDQEGPLVVIPTGYCAHPSAYPCGPAVLNSFLPWCRHWISLKTL